MSKIYKVLKPSYYEKFKCIGSKCESTCCKEWSIPIDIVSYKRYKSVGGSYGKRLKASIEINNSKTKSETWYGQFKFDKNNRCKLLTDNNLCSVYSELGEENMCLTCKIYPRSIKRYNDICEKNLIISCPEVSRLLCENSEPFDFLFGEEEINDLEEKVSVNYLNVDVYNVLWEVRSFYIEMAQYRKIDLWKRLYFILRMQTKVDKYIKNREYNEIFKAIEKTKKEITSNELIKELDGIEKVTEIKLKVLDLFLNNNVAKKNIKESVDIFNEYILVKDKNEVIKLWNEKEEEYENKYNQYNYIYENYITYYIYEYYFECMDRNNLKELTISYMLLRSMNLLHYIKYGEINKDIIRKNIFLLARIIDNSKEYLDLSFEKIKEFGYGSREHLIIFIR